MSVHPDPATTSGPEDRGTAQAPWLALIVLVLAQLQMGINVNVLPVSLGPISDDLDAPATAVATALVLYSLFVAAFVMVGAKIGKLIGERLAGDVGALRGVANNVSSALGSAFAGVVAVGLLGVIVATEFNRSDLPPELETEINLDTVDFVANDQLRSVLGATSATPEQVEEAVAINEDARRRALQASFLILAGISLLAIFPAAGLPKYVPGELSAEEIVREATPRLTGAVSPA